MSETQPRGTGPLEQLSSHVVWMDMRRRNPITREAETMRAWYPSESVKKMKEFGKADNFKFYINWVLLKKFLSNCLYL